MLPHKPSLTLLKLKNTSIFQQLQLEEALLRADNRNWCILNQGSPPSIVMGISGQPEQLIDNEKQQESPLPLIRRFSGGGTVVVDQHTWFVTFICNTSSTQVNCCPQKVLHWTGNMYRSVFPKGFHLKENDYAIGDRKFGGNAQYFRKERWLHHSSLLWDYSPTLMNYLLLPKKRPVYREQRSHADFLCRLRDCEDNIEHFSHFEERLKISLEKQFTIEAIECEEAEKTLHLPHRKATILVT